MEPETRIGDKGIQYLGCLQRCFSIEIALGRMAFVMDYAVEEFLGSCVDKYCELAKVKRPLRHFATPILPDDHALSVAGALGTGPVTECPWCHHADTPASFVTCPSVAALARKPATRSVLADEESQQGELHAVASRVLMNVLWGCSALPS